MPHPAPPNAPPSEPASAPASDPRHATALAYDAIAEGNLPLAWCAASELRRRRLATPAILNMLGLIEVKVGAYGAAREALAEATKLSPRDAGLRENLLEALELESRFGANALMGEAPPASWGVGGVGGAWGGDAMSSRTHVIRAWGYGFCADVDHVLGHALLAEIEGRTPIVWWGASSLFHDAGTVNAWDEFFEPVGDVAALVAAIEGACGGGSGGKRAEGDGVPPWLIYPAKWRAAGAAAAAGEAQRVGVAERLAGPALNAFAGDGSRLGSPLLVNRAEAITVGDYFVGPIEAQTWARGGRDKAPGKKAIAVVGGVGVVGGHWSFGKPIDEVYRVLVDRYLVPAPRMREMVDEAATTLAIGDATRPVIAVHVREGDKAIEMPTMTQHNAQAMELVRGQLAADPRWRVLLITDSVHAVTRYREAFGPRVLVLDAVRSSDDRGVHVGGGVGSGNRPRAELGREVLRDMLLAARCDRFVGVAFSNVAAMISHLRDWPKGACTLIGEALHGQINFVPHIWPR